MIYDWKKEGDFETEETKTQESNRNEENAVQGNRKTVFRQTETPEGPVFDTFIVVDERYGIPIWTDVPTDPATDFHKGFRQIEKNDEARLIQAMEEYNSCPQCGAQCVRAGGSNKHCPKCGFHEHCCEGEPQS